MQRLRRILEVFAWTAFFTFAAAVLALRYWLLPNIERYRPQIEARVAAAVGQPIRIGAIDAGWDGLRPQIGLSDVRIYDAEGREALVLPSVENILSWRSLLHGEVRLRALRIQAPRLAVRRDAAGTLYVAGIKLGPGDGDSGFTDRLLGQEEIEVRNAEIEWRDEKRGAPPLVLSGLDLRVRSDGDKHSFGLVARPPLELSTRLELRGELDGRSLREASGWSGKLFAELGYTELAGWKAWVNYPLELEHGTGAVRVWAEIERGKWRQATADVQLSQVAARLGEGLAALRLQSVEGRLQARLMPGDSYELSARGLSVAPEGSPKLPPVDFQVAWKADGGQLQANAVELEPAALLAESLPLPAEMRSLAAKLAPRGQLADVRFEWSGDIAAPARYRAQARFADLGLRPYETLPGFAQLAGTLDASERGGRLYLQSRGAEIELPRVFPEPRLAFDTLSAQVEWQRDGTVLTFNAPTIAFSNADVSGNAFGSYVYPGGGPGTIDFSAALTRADAKNLAHYLPLGTLMGEKTRAWLAQGILAGHATDVQVRLKGDLRDFPFLDPALGQFLVRAQVQKGQLHYADGWPDITDIDGELVFERDRVDIAGRSGHVLGARVRDVHVAIDRLGKGAVVEVKGGAEGPTAEFFKFLAASPLRSGAGRFTETMSAEGAGHLKLHLQLPIAELKSSKVSGEYEFADNKVTLYRDVPPVEGARGRLAFTQSSFALRELRGRLFGGSLAASGGTRGAAGALEFSARGDAQPATLEPFLDERLRARLGGSASYTATLSLREGVQRLVIDSQLRGVTSELPAPFEKAAADALPLKVDVITSEAGARQRVSVALGRLAAAELLRRRDGDAMQLQRASLAFAPAAGAPVRLPERPGVLLYGSLASVDADRWRAVMGGPVVAGGSLPATLELKIGRLDAYGRRFNNVAFRGTADGAGWAANVDADEIAGQLSYKTEGAGLVTARLLHLSLAKESAAQAAEPPTRAATLPSIDFVAERLALRGGLLGRVELKAQRSGEDWRIENLAITNDDATVALSGTWRTGVIAKSDISFEIDAYDAGRFMTRLGYPGMVLGSKVQLAGALAWQGNTLTPDYATLSGDLKMTAEEGEFLEIDPGLGKLVSLMNLQALPRRIALDFRDVFSKGFRFDRIDATARLERGIMDAKEFRMRGPAAEVTMAGSVDMAHETQNLKVRVVPSLGGAASTAVVGIVNPVAGVAAALAQAVLKNPLGQIFSYEYQVTGGWADPKVARLTVAPMPNVVNQP